MAVPAQPTILIPQSREKNPATSSGSFARLRMTGKWIQGLPVRVLSTLIWLYQKTVSPALVVIDPTAGCRFAPTCSHYARGALEEHGLLTGTWLTVCRLAKCGPWHPGGEDPVPARKPTCTAVRSGSSLTTRHSPLS